ncbi:MAG: cache domain-containing protein, partial [Gammaproteobacteria bacterium]|nr:cache domain-containing protein [Gammaproteobacteria bacterium]
MRKFFLLIVFASVGFVALLGSFSFTMIEKQFKNSIDEAFHSTLYITQQGLKSWVEENKHTVNAIATSPKVIDLTKQLLSTQRTPHQLINSPAQKKLRKELSPLLLSHGLRGFFIIAPENVSLASTRDANTGTTNLLMNQSKFLDRLWAGESLITLPQISDVPLKNEKGQLVANYPTMFSGAPIRDQKGEIIALVTLRINPFKTYTQVLQRGHIGSTGETYAFNSSGVMISNSRFDNQLHRLGILEQGKRSMLNVRQIIPSRISLNELPNNQSSTDSTFTLMFKSVLKEKSGRNLDGYLDYRGSKVIGVWIWDD